MAVTLAAFARPRAASRPRPSEARSSARSAARQPRSPGARENYRVSREIVRPRLARVVPVASVPARVSATTADDSAAVTTTRERKRICIFVEPSPFSHVSGMKNRFLRLIENLVELGDDVVVVTPDRNPPQTYAGAEVIGVHGFNLPFYMMDTLLFSYAKDPRVEKMFKENPPDLIHCSSPGALIWTAVGLSDKYNVPLVQSYHTHIPHYIPRYTWSGLVKPMWDFIRFWTNKSDVTMVTSSILQDELDDQGCPRLMVWQKGVDTVQFNPRFRSDEMHARLCGGRDGKVIGCVGRLGAEKNLADLKDILARCPPDTNLALIGDGPERAKLEKHFEGTRTTFMGMMTGDDLAAAYASLDVFVMPSESETLGFVVMEAMASGVPVVAVRAGGLQDILTDPAVRATNSGELYESGDFAAAGAMTTKLLTDEKERQRQAAGLNEAVQTWSWMASNTKLRDTQYARAFKRHARNQHIKVPIELVDSRRARAWIATEVMGYQWYLQAAAFLFAFGAFAVARSVVASSAPLAVAGGGQGWSAIGAVQWLVNLSGPLGPAIMASCVAVASLVPFVPTQPLFALAGLMFGAWEGAVVSVVGALEAAAVAFAVTRISGVQKTASALANGAGFGAPARRWVRDQLRRIDSHITDSTTLGQFVKLTLYRLVPHAPFTVANYLLGLTKVPTKVFLASTVIGTIPWAAFYALVGAAGNVYLAGGAGGGLRDAAGVVGSVADVPLVLAVAVVTAWPLIEKYALGHAKKNVIDVGTA